MLGRRQPTQVGRALEELGIQLILAHSPRAKGRSERLWRTVQDRLLPLAKAQTEEEANQVLWNYLPASTPGSACLPGRRLGLSADNCWSGPGRNLLLQVPAHP